MYLDEGQQTKREGFKDSFSKTERRQGYSKHEPPRQWTVCFDKLNYGTNTDATFASKEIS